MGIFSTEEAKAKLSECNVLIKYMNFLQANGFTDCGKGQILGQVSLIKECLGYSITTNGENAVSLVRDKEDTRNMGMQAEENGAEKNQSPYLKVDETSEVRSGHFRQDENLITEGSREMQQVPSDTDESLSGEFKQLTNDNTVRTDKARGLDLKRTEGSVTKELNGSWLEKIKRITEIEEWR
jgi:hypothetical protein